MANPKQPVTKVLETLKVGGTGKDGIKSAEALVAKLGRALGSPINGKEEGDEFPVTLTGNIEIREFNGTKGAYFTTKEGYSIRVNASFDPAKHSEGKVLNAVCRVLVTDDRKIKFCSFAD